jgi:hypothetical protein
MLTPIALVLASVCILVSMHYCLVVTGGRTCNERFDLASPGLREPDVFLLVANFCLTVFHPGFAFPLRGVDTKTQKLENEI